MSHASPGARLLTASHTPFAYHLPLTKAVLLGALRSQHALLERREALAGGDVGVEARDPGARVLVVPAAAEEGVLGVALQALDSRDGPPVRCEGEVSARQPAQHRQPHARSAAKKRTTGSACSE